MPTRVFIDGRISDERGAMVSVFDRGFLYGDGIYEVTRTASARPVDLDRHLDRLERSAGAIGLVLPARSALVGAVESTLADAGNSESYIRIIVTRGSGDIGLDPALADRPLLVVVVRPLVLPAPELYEYGVAVAIVAVQRNSKRALDPAVKSGNYLNNIMGLSEAKARGAYESMMLNEAGFIAEGSSSNLFMVRENTVYTPTLEDGLLAGITRGRVIEIAVASGLVVSESHLRPDDLRSADEAFLTSSLRGILPVTVVDGVPIGVGAPGPITRRLLAQYAEFLAGQ